jgi:hypothetical protein
LLLGSFQNLTLSEEQKVKSKYCFEKKQIEKKIFEEKELDKHLSFVNRRRITEEKERQLKAIN